MDIYTKTGDTGTTSLMNGVRVSKTDDRIELLGTIDELNSLLGLAKVLMCEKGKANISEIQQDLIVMMSGIADPRNADYKFQDDMITKLEKKIDKMEEAFPREHKFVLYGGTEVSARLDVARAVARRVERRFRKVNQVYGADQKAMQYINRLSDYLYVYARYVDYQE